MAVSSSTVLRVRGLPHSRNTDEIMGLLERSLQNRSEASGLKITSLAKDPYQVRNQMATIMFLKEPPRLFTASTTNQWSVKISESDPSLESDADQTLTFDTHFRGLTALSTPRSTKEAVDCLAICGLGGHAFGSFKEKGTSYMWLRDSLPKHLPNLRVLLYGYESGLDGSDSNQNVSVIADSFIGDLRALRPPSEVIATPLIIIAHSLGGLVVKQAIIKLGHGDELDKKYVESVVGMLFFGVPNRGMDIESLRSIVCDRKNRYLLESVGQYSDLLLQQDGQFGSVLSFKDSPIVSFYETKSSPTAIKVGDTWKMAGPKQVLVNRFSATMPRLWESDDEPFDRTHSDLVKYCDHDVHYERVLARLRNIASKATAILTSRYLSQENPDSLDADEVACLQSLSFAEIYARENIIEPALQHTGSWLLESKDFDAWSQRNRLDEHRGFFWIQGNPGSGKSTLMKLAYSHMQACSQDPSTVIAAFFFNARGSEIEKSPTGLFRTLLHGLCQHISALRDKVVRAYVEKRRFSKFEVQWQLSELKKLLTTVVTSKILGRRKLILIVDALDECDLGAIQSVVQTFEDLASAALSENTNFNICLSSRYWPQIRVPKCFMARVELENRSDIVMYIQKRLESAHINEQDLALFNTLKKEILNKAQGTFLWVVLVVQELLHANIAGATLGELREIVGRIPPDLSQFYEHQLRSTEGEDRKRMSRLFQVVFFAQRPLSPTELRYALAFGSEAYVSYAEWSQSSEYIRSDEQMEKRVREHSKGLVEFTLQDSAWSGKTVVQFVHQTVRDFLTARGFLYLFDTQLPTWIAKGNEFMKTICLNYLRVKELDTMLDIGARVCDVWLSRIHSTMSTRAADHPFLRYAVDNVFPHAALAEKHGISQNGFRAYLCGNAEACFERWRYLHDISWGWFTGACQGDGARPIHSFAQHGLLSKEIAEKEANIDVAGGRHKSALATACLRGHEDTVELLLSLGADPAQMVSSTNDQGFTYAFEGAVKNQHLPIIRRLLNDRRSFLTLPKKLWLVASIKEDSSPHLKAALDLLVPEATIPDTANLTVCSIANQCAPRILSSLLDKCKDSILHEEELWFNIISSERDTRTSKLENLLDRGGTIKITGTLLRHCHGEAAKIILLLLSEDCEVEMTDDLMNAISFLKDSSQALSALERAGCRFNAFTGKQLLQVLEHGSAESAAFFLQRNKYNVTIDEMLISALGNEYNGLEVTRLLLGYLDPDSITEQAIIAALRHRTSGGDLVRLLHSRRSGLIFSKAALAVAVKEQSPNVVKFILEESECVKICEEILVEALRNRVWDNPETLDILLLHDPDIRVRESTIIDAIHVSGKPEILEMFCKHNKSLFGTEDVIRAALTCSRPEVLEIVLQQGCNTKVSSSMIMKAMKAPRGAAKISVMLHHDHTLVIEEEHLIAAASSRDNPSLIFELLQTRGKLDIANPASESLSTAKRRKVSHKPPPRISSGVLNAALFNPSEQARGPLLRLFLNWGLIIETDYTKSMSNPYPSLPTPSSLGLPPDL